MSVREAESGEWLLDREMDNPETGHRDAGHPAVKAVDVRRAAMNMLARREHARGEMQEKLLKRFPQGGDLVAAELDRLAAEGLQSDSRMAEAFIRARVRRGQGPVRISMDLRSKGVSEDLISAAFAEQSVDWIAQAREVAERKFVDLDRFRDDLRLKGKAARFLQQRGFTFDHISALF